ncbi:MAG: hypothetical protein JXM75_10525 [Chromatiaceae bacterium]|nr:hypothetical protein [Chromatiaceae bacterium]
MLSNLHRLAGVLAFLLIAAFLSSTLVAELFLSQGTVVVVKQVIVYALFILAPLLMITGGSGFQLGRAQEGGLIAAKRRRMPLIALNGVFVLIPLAIYLHLKAAQGEFDVAFYLAQAAELLAGAGNLWLMGLNIRDGMRLRGRFPGA